MGKKRKKRKKSKKNKGYQTVKYTKKSKNSKKTKRVNKTPNLVLEIKDEKTKLSKGRKILRGVLRTLAFIGVTLLLIIVIAYGVLCVVMKGPSEHAKELFVLSANESSVGIILAQMVLDQEEIDNILSVNQAVETDEITDTSLVTIEREDIDVSSDQTDDTSDNNEKTQRVFTEFDTNVKIENGIEFHEIQGATFRGIMAVVYDPSRVFVGTSVDGKYNGAPGKKLMTISDKYDALLTINGAFFEDTDGFGDGSIPLGHVFSEGLQCCGGNNTSYRMMGFTDTDVLVCGNMNGKEANNLHIRDGVSCNPYLVINGEPVDLPENSGLNPRTALGQRKDGMVLMLVIDGRQSASLGATMVDLRDVMLAFGAVNAGNLDGGGSTVMYYNNEVLNVVASVAGIRGIPNAICVRR